MPALHRLIDQITEHKARWIKYEQEFILPQFKWAESVGIDLRKLVEDNPGKNCSQLLFEAMRTEMAVHAKAVENHKGGDITAQAQAWSAVYQLCEKLGLLETLPPDAFTKKASGLSRVLHFIQSLHDRATGKPL